METHYFEAYNQDNVHLIDINETLIECITQDGIKTTDREYEFDIVIYATGFDAITGAFDRIEFTGVDGQKLSDKWVDGPITYLGLQTAGFPNLITIAGPQGGSVATNFPRGIEEAVEWNTELLKYLRKHNYNRIEPKADAEDEWTAHVKHTYSFSLLGNSKSWFTGYNSNVEGHDKIRYMIYNGGAVRYRQRLAEVVENGYQGFDLR
jgi:cation diffusion facilitator CzcD-associated flavoprotein CzcO